MPTVNTLTPKGRELVEQVEGVELALGGCPADRMNEAVAALTAVVKSLILNDTPLWEKESL